MIFFLAPGFRRPFFRPPAPARITNSEIQLFHFQSLINQIVIYNYLDFASFGKGTIFASKTKRETVGDRLMANGG